MQGKNRKRPWRGAVPHGSLAPDLTGRLLVIKNLEDQRGRVLQKFDMNLSGVSLGLSLIVTFQ